MMKNSTIALVANSTWNMYNYRRGLIRRLKMLGAKVLILAPEDPFLSRIAAEDYDEFIPLSHLSPQHQNPFGEVALLNELFRIYRQTRPETVLHYTVKPNIFGSMAAGLAGIPSIATITGLGYPFLHPGLAQQFVPRLYRRSLRWASRIVFHNDEDRQLFLKEKIISPEKSLVVPGSGVDTAFFHPFPQQEESRFVFLFLGRLLWDKGLGEFAEAARKIRREFPQAEFRVAGCQAEGNPVNVPAEKIRQWTAEGSIRFLGFREEIRDIIRQAHVLVLPSYREGMPRAVLEGMAMGKPVVTTRVPGCRDCVKEGFNGFLVPAKDPAALAVALRKMIGLNPEKRALMGRRSRQIAEERFCESVVVKQYCCLINELIHVPAFVPLRTTGQAVF